MKEICFILYIFIVINLSTEEEQNFCDLNHNCDNCTYCGSSDNNYCSCNFYNSYCLDQTSNESKFSFDFLSNYDGCITNNGNMENICGESNIALRDIETKTINFRATTSTNFLCYYNFHKTESNNKLMGITISKRGNQTPNFDLYYICYSNNIATKKNTFSDQLLINKDHYDIVEYNCDKISFYFDIKDPKYLDDLSLLFYYEDRQITPATSIPSTTPSYNNSRASSSSSNTGLIIGIVIGGIVVIAGIITAVILINKNMNKKKINDNINNSNNNNITINNNYPEYTKIVNKNKEKLDNLFKTEILPTKFNKNNVSNDCYNCTICMEDYIDNQSTVITTNCGHIFHQKCFKNWVYKNILCPKCPNCNYLILGPESNIDLGNISMPSTINNYTYQSTGVGNTLGLAN